MKKTLLLIIVIFLLNNLAIGQGISCGGASPFCTGSNYTFPAGVNAPAAPPAASPGPNYGCLGSEPNPAWYYMQVGQSGNIEIFMHGSGNQDIDFCCWGPYLGSQTTPCLAGLTAGSFPPTHHAPGPSPNYPSLNMIDCSYSGSDSEWCYIPNAVSGQYYILLITNYSNQVQNVDFSQSNVGQTGAGTTNCGIMPTPIHNNGPLCQGDTLKLSANTVAGAMYSWMGPGGWTSLLQNPIRTNVTAAMAGNYTCLIIVGTQTSAEDTTVVVIHPKPTVTATSDTICAGEVATITASGASTYKWTPGNSTSNPLITSPLVTTNYKVVGTSAFGCKDSAQAIIKVNPNPVVTVNNVVICNGETATLTANGAPNYLWSTTSTSNPLSVNPSTSTSYIVTGTDNNNCFGKDTAYVTVHPRPNISLDSLSLCKGKSGTMTVIGGAYNTNYTWSNGSTGSPLQLTPTNSTLIEVYAVDSNGCKDTASAMINVYPLPVVNFTATPTIASTDDPLISFTDLSTNAFIWHWDFGDRTSPNNTSTQQSPTHTYVGVGEFVITLNVETDHGCKATTQGKVLIENPYEFFVPNAFNPSSSNIESNNFKPKGIGIDPSKYSMIIYDRWGKEIFSTTDFTEGWNGKFKNVGDIMPAGVYVYIIRFTKILGSEKQFSGHVTLL